MYSKEEHFVVESIENRNGRNQKVGKFYCLHNGKTYTTIHGLRRGITSSGLSTEEYYTKFYKVEGEGVCEVCGIPTSFVNVVDGFSRFCSSVCYFKTIEHREKVSNRFVNSPEKLESFREKRKDWFDGLSEEEKKDISRRRVATTRANNPTYYEDMGRKRRKIQTDLHEADPERKRAFYAKVLEGRRRNNSFGNGMSGKVSTFEYDGKMYKFQGYEDIMMLHLLNIGIDFDGRGEVPAVSYSEAMSGIYIPDLYLPMYNLLIDVKSERTITMKPDVLVKKQNAALEQGYNFIYFVISSKYVNKQRQISEIDRIQFKEFLDMLISNQALNEGRFNDYPVIRSTLQAIGSGYAESPFYKDCDIV